MVSGLLRARLSVLGESETSRPENLKLCQLFLLYEADLVNGIGNSLEDKLSSDISKIDFFIERRSLPNSSTDEIAFFEELNNAILGHGDVIEFSTHKSDCFDGCLLISTSNGPLLVLHDVKSSMIRLDATATLDDSKNTTTASSDRKKYTMDLMPNQGKQARKLMHLASTARSLSKESKIAVNPSSALEALINNAYIYVYVNSNEAEETFAACENDCVMQLGGKDVKRMLSFFGDFYTFARGSANVTQVNEYPKKSQKSVVVKVPRTRKPRS
jgi:hypothetical protein